MAIGAYGIINRLLMLYVMVVMGLTMGMQPIVGYNYGAQKIDRVKHTLRLGIIVGVLITSSGFSMPVSDGLAFVTAVVILMVYIKKVKEKTSGQKL